MFRFSRFLQQTFTDDANTALTIAKALAKDQDLLDSYAKFISYSSKLTNPQKFASLLDLIEGNLGSFRGDMRILPQATSRHAELFLRLFPQGLPTDTDLMRELIRAIRSAKVNLEPRDDSGWFDYQVFALESLLVPEKGPESAKLLLTKSYKKRMLDAFKALVTKRIETHVRDWREASSAAPMMINQPLLRIEPCPSYYLRTAQAYGFLKSFLEREIAQSELAKLHGLRSEAVRTPDLAAELESMRNLFYGFYLVSCEDIGLKPAFYQAETPDPKTCRESALAWVQNWKTDEDLAVDTRASVPIYSDTARTRREFGHRLASAWASSRRAMHIRRAVDRGLRKAGPPATPPLRSITTSQLMNLPRSSFQGTMFSLGMSSRRSAIAIRPRRRSSRRSRAQNNPRREESPEPPAESRTRDGEGAPRGDHLP